MGLESIFSIVTSFADVLKLGARVDQVLFLLSPIQVKKLRSTSQKTGNLLRLAKGLMLGCLIVIIVLATYRAFKFHHFKYFSAKSRKFLSFTVRPAAGTTWITLQPRIDAVRAEQLLTFRAKLGVPNDA